MKTTLIIGAMAAGVLAFAAEGANGSGMMINPKCKTMVQKKIALPVKKSAQSPFLITHGLPHLTKKVKMMWDDPKLALSDEQKAKLLEVRKQTIGTVKRIKSEVTKLQHKIVTLSKSGESTKALEPLVEKLADLKAEATMAHLKCLEKTKAILSKDQLFYLMSTKKKHTKRQGKPEVMPAAGRKMMKCAPGKCGASK
jgi:Spy/CpxP family protein refolding chaperone